MMKWPHVELVPMEQIGDVGNAIVRYAQRRKEELNADWYSFHRRSTGELVRFVYHKNDEEFETEEKKDG